MRNLAFSSVKAIAIPEGAVKEIARRSDGIVLWQKAGTNMIPLSTTNDGKTVYNGGLGYKNNTRLNSSAAEVALNGYVVSGYIPAKAGDIVRIKGVTWNSSTQTGGYFWTFDSSFAKLKYERPNEGSSLDITASVDQNGVVVVRLESYATSVAYVRFSAYGTGENAVVTINEEIV